MRILQISDTHLGAAMNARGPEGWRRADDHHLALERALEPVFRGEVDAVVHAGDVFDRSRPPTRDVERAGVLFQRVARRVPVLGIAGNHDRRGIRRWLPHRSLRFTDVPVVERLGELSIGLLPYRRDPERFAADRRGLGAVDLLVCHQGFVGSRVPGFTFREGRPSETIGARHLGDAGYVASGHIHPRQVLEIGGTTVVHGGSTERTAFSEADQRKGSVLWTFGARTSFEFRDHPTRSMDPNRRGALVRCAPEDVAEVVRSGRVAVLSNPAGKRGFRSRPPASDVALRLF